jgi:hypothetical protein
VDFIKKIREEVLGKSYYEMYKALDFSDTKSYQDFERASRAVNVQKLVKLWRLSGLSGDEFMDLMAQEVEGATKKKRAQKK